MTTGSTPVSHAIAGSCRAEDAPRVRSVLLVDYGVAVSIEMETALAGSLEGDSEAVLTQQPNTPQVELDRRLEPVPQDPLPAPVVQGRSDVDFQREALALSLGTNSAAFPTLNAPSNRSSNQSRISTYGARQKPEMVARDHPDQP
jgi:hypothetical protein